MPITSNNWSVVNRAGKSSAFTLLEVLATFLVLAILATLFLPSYGDYMRRAQEAKCAANLRALNIGLRGYLHDHQSVWPQGPSLIEEKAWETFWLDTLKPYGITPRDWRCPTIQAAFSRSETPPDRHAKVHYIPTMFTAEPDIANRWTTQPWLIERSNAHGEGPLICFPDGSVKSARRVLAEMGVR